MQGLRRKPAPFKKTSRTREVTTCQNGWEADKGTYKRRQTHRFCSCIDGPLKAPPLTLFHYMRTRPVVNNCIPTPFLAFHQTLLSACAYALASALIFHEGSGHQTNSVRKTMAGLELENGRDLRTEDSTTSKERSPQDQVNGTTNDESSPKTSPKRKPSVPQRGQGGSCVQKPRLKTDTLRSRLWNSVKRTVKRNSVVGLSSRGSVDVEASDFSFRQPPRGSPVSGSHNKKGSPSLELHVHRGLKCGSAPLGHRIVLGLARP